MKVGVVMEAEVDSCELKQKLLSMLEQVLAICEKYDLRVYGVGGTALGAVRHNGFIPWDDDIDVALPRPDFERFLQVAQSELPEGLFLQTYRTDPDYRFPFAKVRDDRTTFFETSTRHLHIHRGIFVDLFPVDGYPDSEKIRKRLDRYRKLAFAYASKDFYPRRTDLKYKFKLALVSLFFGFRSTASVLAWFDKKCMKYSYEDCDETICHCAMTGDRDHFPKDYYGDKGAGVPFESLTLPVPVKTDTYLKHKFGDYMKFPPKEQQVPHHYCDVIDLDKSYTEYEK